MKTQDVLPVLASVLVLVLIAAVEKQSKSIAAITATMPVNMTLALWIIYSAVVFAGSRCSTYRRGPLK